MDRGAWWATLHGVAKSQTRLSDFIFNFFHCCFMSGSNCCFLTCKHISQEAGKVVWYSHLFKNFPQFVVIHTVKGFGIVSKAEVDVFLKLSCFFNDSTDIGNLTAGSLSFSKSSLNIWKFTVPILLKPAWRIVCITFLACEMSAIVQQFEPSLALPFFGIVIKTDFLQYNLQNFIY